MNNVFMNGGADCGNGVLFYNSMFYPFCKQRNMESIRAHYHSFLFDGRWRRLLFVANHSDTHWVAVCIDISRKKVWIDCPLGGSPTAPSLKHVEESIRWFLGNHVRQQSPVVHNVEAFNKVQGLLTSLEEWEFVHEQPELMQVDSFNCGPFAAMYALYRANDQVRCKISSLWVPTQY